MTPTPAPCHTPILSYTRVRPYYHICVYVYVSHRILDLDMQSSVSADGFNIGKWVTAQRSALSAGRLTPERARALDAVGMRLLPQAPPQLAPNYAPNYAYLRLN